MSIGYEPFQETKVFLSGLHESEQRNAGVKKNGTFNCRTSRNLCGDNTMGKLLEGNECVPCSFNGSLSSLLKRFNPKVS